MAKELNSRAQVTRIDGQNCFVEVLTEALPIDKVAINFCSYDKSAETGGRMKDHITFYLPVLDAYALALDIMSDRMTRLHQKSMKEAEAAGSKYPKPVKSYIGGTPAKKANRADGKALSRSFTISPGSKYPWVLCAECGPGEQEEGKIIVPAYGYGKEVAKPEMLVRVPMTQENFEVFAVAIITCWETWRQRFVGLVLPVFDKQNEEWQKSVEKRRSDAA